MRHLMRHLFEGLESLHARNVTHRDLKPANTIVDLRGGANGGEAASGGDATGERERLPSLRLADFGSAVDAQTLQPGVGLYPGEGPSSAEETADYQPPEASIAGAAFDPHDPRTYDLWSAGITILELLLATPHALELSPRAAATLELRCASSASCSCAHALHPGQHPRVASPHASR